MDFAQLVETVDRLTDEVPGLEAQAAREAGIQLKKVVEAIHRETLVREGYVEMRLPAVMSLQC